MRIPRTTATAVPERAGRESQTPSRFARNLEGSERDLFGGRLQDCLVPVLADFCVAPITFIHQAVDVWVSDPGYRRGLECQPILSSAARIIPAITGRGDARGRTSAPARKHAPTKKRQFIVGPPARWFTNQASERCIEVQATFGRQLPTRRRIDNFVAEMIWRYKIVQWSCETSGEAATSSQVT